MIVDTTSWPLPEHPTELTFDEWMSSLVKAWEKYITAQDDDERPGEGRAVAKMELEGEFCSTMCKFLKDNPGALLYYDEGPLRRIMNKVGAESLDELEKKVNKLIMKNKIIEEAE